MADINVLWYMYQNNLAAVNQVPVSDVFERIIENTAHNNTKNNAVIIAINKKNEDLEKENTLLKTKLDEAIEMKNEMEKTLYVQFLYLLNEKKKKIAELKNKLEPVGDVENHSDAGQSDTDPFNTDTDIDSENEQSPSKVNPVEQQGSMDMEEEALTLPKRTRQCGKTEPTAGPSGVSRRTRNSKQTNTNISISEKTKETKKIQKKSLVKSCVPVFGKIAEERLSTNSEEDAFTFPKRSKRIINTNSSNQVKPSTNKVKYESDDETFLDKVEVMDIDVDKTQSQIDLLDRSNLETAIKTEQNEEFIGVNNGKTIKELQNSKRKEASKALNQKAQPQRLTDCCEGLSSATLDMLNQLI